MIWVAVILGILLVAVTLATIAYIALKMIQSVAEVSQTFLSAHQSTLASLERTHDKNVAQINSVLDRFMALDFSLFKAYQSVEGADEGGFVDPEGEEEGGMIAFNAGGKVIRPGAQFAEDLANRLSEEELLREDFDEEFERKEGLRT